MSTENDVRETIQSLLRLAKVVGSISEQLEVALSRIDVLETQYMIAVSRTETVETEKNMFVRATHLKIGRLQDLCDALGTHLQSGAPVDSTLFWEEAFKKLNNIRDELNRGVGTITIKSNDDPGEG